MNTLVNLKVQLDRVVSIAGLIVPLILVFLLASAAHGAEVSFTFSSTLTVSQGEVSGDFEFILNSDEEIYDVQIFVINGNSRSLKGEVNRLEPDSVFNLSINQARFHSLPGRYHLLLEVAFTDRYLNPHTVVSAAGYVYQETGSLYADPPLTLEGDELDWALPDSFSGLEGIDVSTGPYWLLGNDIGQTDTSFTLITREGMSPVPEAAYSQLAIVNWIGSDGYHYSSPVPWVVRTDSEGSWITATPSSGLEPAFFLELVAKWLWVLVLLGSAVVLMRYRDIENTRDWKVFEKLCLVSLLLLLFAYLNPLLWISSSWPTGGDLASHVLYADKFRNWFFGGRISGWMPEVYAGFPAFKYYFPFPFILISVLSLLMPLTIAIKLVVMLPVLLLPCAVYWTGGQMKWSSGARLFAAIFTLGFLVNTGSSIWGGNILSVLAGEFTYAWGMVFTVLFWGVLYRALCSDSKSWMVVAILLEVLIALSHGYALLMAGFSAFLFPVLLGGWKEAIVKILFIHLVAFLLIGFWLLPLIENLPYTVANDTIHWGMDLQEILPVSQWIFLLGFPALVWVLLKNRVEDNGLRFLLLVSLLAAFAYLIAHQVHLADIRFMPYIQLTIAIVLGSAMGQFMESKGRKVVCWSSVLGLVLFANLWLNDLEVAEDWSEWNLSGYENKPGWNNLQTLTGSLQGEMHEPRIIIEHNTDNQDIGSTRAMEALPLFGTRPVLEGLYMESALSGPFIYQLQAEVSLNPSSPLSRFPSVQGALDDLATNLRDFYVNTVVVRSDSMAERLENNDEFILQETIGPWKLFYLPFTPPMIAVEPDIEAVPNDDFWLEKSFRSYITEPPGLPRKVYGLEAEPGIATDSNDTTEIFLETFEDNSFSFRTNRPGEPHLIRMTYHPGWRSAGGEEIYKTAPSFMLLFPESEYVELNFTTTSIGLLGWLFTASGLLLLLLVPGRWLPVARVENSSFSRWLWVGGFMTSVGLVAVIAHPGRLYEKAHSFYEQNKFAEAGTIFDKSLERRSVPAQLAEVRFWSARSYERAGMYAEAIERYEQLIEESPENYWTPESVFRLVLLLLEEGETEQIDEYIEFVSTTFPGNRWVGNLESRLEQENYP